MNPNIIIYGLGDKDQFPTEEVVITYLSKNIIDNGGRFRYTQGKDADVIVLSRDGWAFGHLKVKEKIESTKKDKKEYKKSKWTYLVSESATYIYPIKLYKEFGIRVNSYGKLITREQFTEIQNSVGKITTYYP